MILQGIFSSNSNIFSDSVLVLQWIIFIILLFDWYVAHKRDIKNHKRIILTLFVIQTIFNLYMVLRIFSITIKPLLIIHGTLGFFAYLLILYTILYMTKKLPESLRFVPKEKRIWLMRTTMVVWLFFTISGTIVYITLYL